MGWKISISLHSTTDPIKMSHLFKKKYCTEKTTKRRLIKSNQMYLVHLIMKPSGRAALHVVKGSFVVFYGVI